MKGKLMIAAILLAAPYLCSAQDKVKTNNNGVTKIKSTSNGQKTKTKLQPPAWASLRNYTVRTPVYFPDYYVFYDPSRGYVYWDNNAWTTSLTTPDYLSDVNWTTARMEELTGVTGYPEKRYATYMTQYPAQHVDITVHVPEAR